MTEFKLWLQNHAEGKNPESGGPAEEREEETKTPPEGDTPPEGETGSEPKMFPEDYVQKLRQESANYRVTAKKHEADLQKVQQQMQAIQKALGGDGGEPDVDKLTKDLEAKENQLRTLKLENAFNSVAHKLGADPELALALLSRRGELDALDFDSDINEQLTVLVQEAIEKNPKLKAGEPQPKAGGDPGPGSGGGTQKTDMNALIRRASGRG